MYVFVFRLLLERPHLFPFQNLPRDPALYNDSLSCVYWEFAESVMTACEETVVVFSSFPVQCRMLVSNAGWEKGICPLAAGVGVAVT